jgi:hypothetical protein
MSHFRAPLRYSPYNNQHQHQQYNGYQQQQRQHQYSAPTRPALKTEKRASEKTREVLRHIYPTNLSGSKVICVSLDPAFDFEPVVIISKAGYPGVKLSAQAFHELCTNAEFISSYFRGENPNNGQMQLSPEITLCFEKSYGKAAIVLKSGVQTAAEKDVTLCLATWDYLCKMFPLLQHIVGNLSAKTAYVNQMFIDLVNFVSANFRKDGAKVPKLCEIEQFLAQVSAEDIPQPDDITIDKLRVFYELRQFCLFDIAGALNPCL